MAVVSFLVVVAMVVVVVVVAMVGKVIYYCFGIHAGILLAKP